MLSKPKEVVPAIPEIKVIVGGYGGSGEGRYFYTYPVDDSELAGDTCITVTLNKWTGDRPPVKGQAVLVQGVAEFAKGWRGESACPTHSEKSKK